MKRIFLICVVCFGFASAGLLLSTGDVEAAKLVALWLCDEGKGDKLTDSSGNKHTGDFFGKIKWEKGKFGSGIKFNGVSDHIEVPDPDHKLTPKHITLMAWINLDNTVGNHSIMEQYDWAGNLGCHAFRTNGPALQFYVIWGTSAPNANSGNLKANEWIHATATYDGENIRVYQDGELKGEAKDAAKRNLEPSNKSLSIGTRGDTKDIHWMTGIMDELAIFDDALTEKEIKAIATNDKGIFNALGLDVQPKGKLATSWGEIRRNRK